MIRKVLERHDQIVLNSIGICQNVALPYRIDEAVLIPYEPFLFTARLVNKYECAFLNTATKRRTIGIVAGIVAEKSRFCRFSCGGRKMSISATSCWKLVWSRVSAGLCSRSDLVSFAEAVFYLHPE